ncbi:MAG: AEC family transporter, partial [Phycisphaerae bacterium]|nr:AEC family transporter [Phycisphaerae bacterium]
PFWRVVVFIRGAFVPVALCTLGAQLGLLGRTANKYPVTVSVLLRLLVAPMIGLCVIYALGLRGLMAQVMLVASCTPTSVNSMLLCLEFDNHPDYAARAVFYSTLFSPITVTLVIFLAQSGFGGAF